MATAFKSAIIATVSALFIFGAAKTYFTKRNWVKSGFEMMIVGLLAAGAGYLIGQMFAV